MDDDGRINLDEFVADTDPRDGDSYLALVRGAGGMGVGLSSTGRLYTVESTSNLLAGAWTPVAGQVDVPGNGGDLSVVPEWGIDGMGFQALRMKVRRP